MHGTSPHDRVHRFHRIARKTVLTATFAVLASSRVDAVVTDEQFQQIVQENRALRSMLEAQQAQLDELRRLLPTAPAQAPSVSSPAPVDDDFEPAPVAVRPAQDRRLVFSGEASVVLLAGESDTWYPNNEFRIDDAFLRLDAEVTRDVYFFAEIELGKRTTFGDSVRLGEAYVEFENISGAWGADRLLNVRVGRTDIPFGEEYLRRDPLTNPLVVNSLSDIWGIDEGIVAFGEIGRASYAFAVQNGSNLYLSDFDVDKAMTLRLGYDPTPDLHLSVSAMRTGDLDAVREPLSEVWMSGAVFRSIGSASTTTYGAELAEIDAAYTWRNARLSAAAGIARYEDDDPLADNTRDFEYFQIEGTRWLDRHWWLAARYSSLKTEGGYPMVGTGAFGKYFLGDLLTEELQRFTIGGGYRFADNLLIKVDYTFERGELADGTELTDRDQLAAQVGVGF